MELERWCNEAKAKEEGEAVREVGYSMCPRLDQVNERGGGANGERPTPSLRLKSKKGKSEGEGKRWITRRHMAGRVE